MLWICCNARTGSNLLCDLLNNTKLFPDVHVGEGIFKDKPFGEWLRWTNTIHKTMKVLFDHLKKTDITHHSQVPNTKFVLLKRNNLLEHTASLYFARFTNAYYISAKNQLDWYFDIPITFYPTLTKTLYKEVLGYQTNWNEFLSGNQYMTIIYEEMIQNPKDTLKSLLEYCNMDFNDELLDKAIEDRKFIKMTRPEVDDFISYARSILIEKLHI